MKTTITGASFHRIFVSLASSLSGIGALLAATDTSTLGISPHGAAVIAFVLAAANIVATAIRANFAEAPA